MESGKHRVLDISEKTKTLGNFNRTILPSKITTFAA
jgi:hypothetical protein